MKIVDRWFEDNLSTYVRCVGKKMWSEWMNGGAITNGTEIYRIAERMVDASRPDKNGVVLRLEGVAFLSLGEYTGLAARPEWDAVDRVGAVGRKMASSPSAVPTAGSCCGMWSMELLMRSAVPRRGVCMKGFGGYEVPLCDLQSAG